MDKVYILGLLVWSFMESSISTFQYIFSFFFIWSFNCSGHLFSLFLLASKLYELSLWIIEHILEVSRNVSINLYLRPFSIAIHGKFYLCFLYYFRLFWSVNCTNLVCKLGITFWKCPDTQILFILEIFERI